ncbi:uncharacterized protein LOC114928239 [Nylanderia fulva]|uniref:uncharacterized protein LOC114928239 n=1 Tax=Nylanderia fulva TaxID=613905 RepID=UPI0010FB1DD5|nr:uncharacterized protein LOC114928239 [Nylanderia fulva]
MPKFLEQRYSIKFAVKLGKSPTETVGIINQAYGESAMSRNMIFRWHKMFVEGREDVDDEPRPGRPSTTSRVVHHEFVPEGQTVNAAFYVQVLDRLRKRVARVRPAIKNTWRLQHDNAPSHTALVVSEFLTKHGVTTLPHPPYSPDWAPPDFFLFPKIKRSLKGTRYGTLDAVKEAVTTCLREVPMMPSRERSRNGNAAGTSVSIHKGPILRNISLKYGKVQAS